MNSLQYFKTFVEIQPNIIELVFFQISNDEKMLKKIEFETSLPNVPELRTDTPIDRKHRSQQQ